MAMVRVWNDNKWPHEEDFRGEKIRIEPGEYVKMDFYDAHQFAGQFSPIQRNADGVPLPQTFKKIRIEAIDSEKAPAVVVNNLKCNSCGYKASSDKDLEEHSKIHASLVLRDEEAEAEMQKKRR